MSTNEYITPSKSRIEIVIQTTITIATLAVVMVTMSCVPGVGRKALANPPEKYTVTDSVSAISTVPEKMQLTVDPAAVKWVRFQELAQKWREERGATSSITTMSMAEAYQAIIGMGDDAVPLLIAQLASEGDDPDHWFWALKAITGANPVKLSDRGDSVKMAQSWIEWAKEQGYSA